MSSGTRPRRRRPRG